MLTKNVSNLWKHEEEDAHENGGGGGAHRHLRAAGGLNLNTICIITGGWGGGGGGAASSVTLEPRDVSTYAHSMLAISDDLTIKITKKCVLFFLFLKK